ncbi:MAG: pro-sigmaK processing inhibitor BofA family protein [Methanimicrococcus sp.]|nr:pro-sigmaK processing inhibitor BofA family protein [Methanimicrococcus sp.]
MPLPGLFIDIILIVLAIIIAYALYKLLKTAKKIAINIIVGFLLIFAANLLGITSIPLSFSFPTLVTLIVTALTGVFGALVLIILNIFGFFPF